MSKYVLLVVPDAEAQFLTDCPDGGKIVGSWEVRGEDDEFIGEVEAATHFVLGDVKSATGKAQAIQTLNELVSRYAFQVEASLVVLGGPGNEDTKAAVQAFRHAISMAERLREEIIEG